MRRFTSILLLFSMALLFPCLFIGAGAASEPATVTLEAENGKTYGNAKALSVAAASEQKAVKNLGKSGGTINSSVTFESVSVAKEGYYTLKVYYLSGADDRYFDVTVNGEKSKLPCPMHRFSKNRQ